MAAALGYRYEGRNSWSSVEDLRLHLDPIVADLGRMPKQSELSDRNRYDLINAIHKFGVYQAVAEALAYSYRVRRSWTGVDDLRPHLDPIVRELGRMPSGPVLENLGR